MIPRPGQTQNPDTQSPCVRNCCLDEGDVCMGCGRLLDEILGWHKATNEQRETIRGLAADRLLQRQQRFTS